MRKQPKFQPPSFDPQKIAASPGVITQERTYKLITPLYGGGAIPEKYDEVTIIRGTEIRGLLRYWWRACQGGQFKTVQELKDAEDKIWGKAHITKTSKQNEDQDRKSRKPLPHVQIYVEVIQEGEDIPPYQVCRNNKGKNALREINGIPGYASFPLQPERETLNRYHSSEVPIKPVRGGVEFCLIITFHKDHRKDVEAALWAWETFGGVGARTRRGFGAIRCTGIKEKGNSLPIDAPPANGVAAAQWLEERCKNYVLSDHRLDHLAYLVSHPLQGQHFVIVDSVTPQNPLLVWSDLIVKLSWFRQMRPRPENRSDPGRSAWPEPDAIRRLFSQSIQKHKIPILKPPVYKFPRAAFGLPLPFKFKDDNRKNFNDPNSDPRKSVLQPKGHERLSSPLILKPLACGDGKALGLAFILTGIDVRQVELELLAQEGRKERKRAIAALNGDSFILEGSWKELKQPFMSKIDQNSNILQIFLSYLVHK